MKKIVLLLPLCIIALSCSWELNSDNQSGGSGYSVNGNVQKGPFTQGTSITIQALDDALNPTGKNYQTKTIDDAGTFGINNQIDSRYVEIIATGYYFNEISGRVSNSTITLRALSDLTESGKTNVNLLTTLEIDRIRHLVVSEGMSVSQAREMAEKELFDVFHIPEIISVSESFDKMDITRGGDSNAILLAISATLQGKRSEGELSELVAKIAAELRTAGKIDNTSIQTQIRDGGMSVDAASVRRNLESRYKSLGITEYEIPPFEDYLDVNGNGVIDKHDSWLILSKKDVFISDEGGSFDIDVQHNLVYDVVIETDADGWLSQDVTKSYLETDKLSFTVSANETYDARCARIAVKDRNSELVEYVNVTQKQHDALSVTPSRINLTREGGTFEIEMKANVDVSLEISESSRSWITQVPATKGLVSSVLTFFVTRNDEPLQRHGEIILKSGDLTEKIVVYQAGERVLLLDESDFVVSSKGQNVVVHVTSNIDYDVVMPSVDWIYRTSPTRSLVSKELVFGIRANEGYDDRQAKIVIRAAGKQAVVNITQMQKDAIILAKNRYEFDNNGGELALEVQTNVDFGVEIADEYKDWIKQIPQTKGLETKRLNFRIMPNTSYDGRTGFIRIVNSEAKLQKSISISQGQTNAIILSESNFDFPDAGGSFSVKVSSNVTYEMAIGASWLHWVQTKGLTDNSYEFIVDKNTTYDSREATVTFIDKTTGASGIVTVRQSQKDAIILGSDKYSLTYEGGTVAVKLKSNVKYDVAVADDADWISYVPATKALTESVVSLSVSKNQEVIERTGTVTIKNTSSGISNTVTITQSGNTETFVVNVPTVGTLSTILSDVQKANIVSMKVTGIINKDDFKTMEKMPKLTELDLGEVKVAGNIVPDEAMGTYSGRFGVTGYSSESKLQRIVLPDEVISIGKGAFCIKTLESINMPRNLTAIKEYAFNNAVITEVTIPANVLSIEQCAFLSCRKLETVNFAPESKLLRLLSSASNDPLGNSSSSGVFRYCVSLKRIEIPSSVNYIGVGTFYGCSSLKELIIPEDTALDKIEGYYYLDNSVLGAKPVTGGLIEGCYALKEIKIPSKIKSLDRYAFANSGVRSVIFSEDSQCERIGEQVFANCLFLTNITLPSSVKTVSDQAFVNCNSLEFLDLSNVETLGNAVVSGCSSLQEILLPKNTTEIKDNMFYGCAALERCTLSNNVRRIGKSAFRKCSSLKTIPVSESLEIIDECAFEECSSLSTVVIPKKVSNVGRGAFSNCENLTEFHLEHQDSIILGSSLFRGSKKLSVLKLCAKKIITGSYLFSGTNIYEFEMPEEVEYWGIPEYPNVSYGSYTMNTWYGPFDGSMVSSITFAPNSRLKECGALAFAGAKYISSLTLPPSVEIIGADMLRGDEFLTDFNIPSHIKKITGPVYSGSYVISPIVENSANLEYVGGLGLMNTVNTYLDLSNCSYLGTSALSYCEKLENVKLKQGGVLQMGDELFRSTPNVKEIVIPSGLKELRRTEKSMTGPFEVSAVECVRSEPMSCLEYSDISFQTKSWQDWPASLKTIDLSGVTSDSMVFSGKVFQNCSALEYLNLPHSSELFLPASAFTESYKLTKLTIPATIKKLMLGDKYGNGRSTSISEIYSEEGGSGFELVGCFNDCTALETVNIDALRIPNGCFRGCKNLKSLILPMVRSIGDRACGYCSSLRCVSMPNVESIGKEAFNECTELSSPMILNKIVSISTRSFEGCGKIEFMDLASTLASIFDDSFPPSLKTLICRRVEPLKMESGLRGFTGFTATLYVPAESVELYKKPDYEIGPWSRFKGILPIE